MCTLTLWWRSFADAPVVVAANRDEDPRRAWTSPAAWPVEQIFAGRDLVGGGTWLGVNRHGVLCGLTNLWGAPPDPSLASRGAIVLAALAEKNADAAARAVAAIPLRRVNPFVLLAADADSAWRVDHAGTVERCALTPGIHVLANWGPHAELPRSERARTLAEAIPTSDVAAALPGLRALVADHEGAAIRGTPICGHGDDYATVCSTLIALGRTTLWRDARGNPCVAEWADRTLELVSLLSG